MTQDFVPNAGRLRRHLHWIGLAVLLVTAFALYLATLDNGVEPRELAGGDLITHQYAQVQARPSNAPGYPLYTMGGWLWFHGLRALLGQAGNPTAILSAYSTLWALIALALLYRLILDLTANWPVALLSGAFYAVTYFFWFYAVSTEQYTSAVALTLAVVLLAFRWDALQERQGPEALQRPAGDGYLLALAFLSGLILAHLVTVAFIIPPLIWFLLSRRPGLLRRPRLLAQAAGLALLPLISYAFVYVRGAQHPQWRGEGQWPTTWAWFWDFLSTRQGREELTWALQPLWTAEFPGLIWQELTWVVLLGGLAGLVLLGRRRGTFLATTLLIYLLFSFVDRLGNWYQVIMPAYALLVVGFAVAVQWLWSRLARMEWRRPALTILATGLLLLVALRFAWSLPHANQRNRPEDTGLVAGQAILADRPAVDAAVMGVVTQTLSLRYLTEIWQQRPDVAAIGSTEAAQALADGQRPLFVTNAAVPILLQEVSPDVHLSSAGATLVRAAPVPTLTLPPSTQPLNMAVGDSLSLAAYEVLPTADGPTRVRLHWQADGSIGQNWSISVRPTLNGQLLLEGDGIVQRDLRHPVHGFYPTSRWTPGEVVADDYFLDLPDNQPMDGIQVVVYRALADGQFENLATLALPLP